MSPCTTIKPQVSDAVISAIRWSKDRERSVASTRWLMHGLRHRCMCTNRPGNAEDRSFLADRRDGRRQNHREMLFRTLTHARYFIHDSSLFFLFFSLSFSFSVYLCFFMQIDARRRRFDPNLVPSIYEELDKEFVPGPDPLTSWNLTACCMCLLV